MSTDQYDKDGNELPSAPPSEPERANYVDSRTPEEKEHDKKIQESVIVTTHSSPTPIEEIERKIQKDLDRGKFGKICSNETTFKNYILSILNRYK